ncbi:MAG TPA: hypothetical protein VHD57_00705 [Vicinamibacterales bacterium]|jgi:hypothetical protein|nr:hypothetical protein [Vicinamibacterales bacterium]
MQLTVNRSEGRANDLVVRLDRDEIETARLSVADRAALMRLPGIPRHRPATSEEEQGLAAAKIGIVDHLRRMGVVAGDGRVARPAIAISNRNLGTNHGHLAWQRGETPAVFHVREDPCDRERYACLTIWRDGRVSIEDLVFDEAAGRIRRASDGRDLSDDVEWATAGQPILRQGRVARIDEIADQFYDVRHVLAFDPRREEGEAARQAIYRDYPRSFRDNVRSAWRDLGVPRARYVHNAVGVSTDGLVIVQREGTIEEIGAALFAAGADDGIILDNGGSVVCWAWWANDYAGGVVSPTVDYRPPGTSAVAFILKGPTRINLPGGSVSYSVY